jgi:hypothetical protein
VPSSPLRAPSTDDTASPDAVRAGVPVAGPVTGAAADADADGANAGAGSSPAAQAPRAPRRRSRTPWVVALVLYTALVAVVVGWPDPVDAGVRDDLYATIHRLRAEGWPAWITYDNIERGANMAMFVPLGVLLTVVTRRWWWGLLVPAALSAAAELGQLVLRPDRFATWTDLATNTAGAAIGVALVLVVRALARASRVRGRGTPGSTAAPRRP